MSKSVKHKHKHKRKTRKNVARGKIARTSSTTSRPRNTSLSQSEQYPRRLSPITRQRATSPVQTRSNLRTPGQSARSTRRRVQINTPENQVLMYSLGSSELEWKQASPMRGIPNCRNPREESDFPCKMKHTVFRNKSDFDRYKRLKRERNESTGYKSREQHYDEISSMLTSEGSNLLRK